METKTNEDLAYEAAMAAAAEAYQKHPEAASYCYDKYVLPALRSHMEVTRESLDRIRARALKEREPWSKTWPIRAAAAWAVYTVCDGAAAWMTPGFAEAKRYNDLYGS